MTTIVCGIDNSPTAAAAARKAAELSVALGARLHLLSAYGKVESETVEVGSETILVSNEMEAERVQGIGRVLGSIARDVAAHAPCDVYVAHTHTHRH